MNDDSSEEESSMEEENPVQVLQERLRREEIIGAMDIIPNNMDFSDGCILLDLLNTIRYETRYHQTFSLSEFWNDSEVSYQTDPNGRITELLVDHIYCIEIELSPIIERLQKLTDIQLHYIRLIPEELDNLPLLKNIEFHFCPQELYENIPDGLQLVGLKRIQLSADGFLPPPMFELITNRLDSLEQLIFRKTNSNDYDDNDDDDDGEDKVGRILHSLKTDDICFRQSLKNVTIIECDLKESHLETLLFDVLPRFPNLREFCCDFNQIESLQTIESRIKRLIGPTQSTAMAEHKLQVLSLNRNPILTNIVKDPKEREALLTILNNTFNAVFHIGRFVDRYYDSELDYGPEVEYLLGINHAGRKFIAGEATITGVDTIIKQTIKPELWPKILERAYMMKTDGPKYKKECATGVFYMLRNGSVLKDIIEIWQGSSNVNGSRRRIHAATKKGIFC